MSSNTWRGGIQHFLDNIDTFLNIYCDEVTSLKEDHCCNVFFTSSFCNLGGIYCSTNFTFSKFFKKYCKIEVKTQYAFSDTLAFQLIALIQIYSSNWDSETTPINLYFAVIGYTMSALRIAPDH